MRVMKMTMVAMAASLVVSAAFANELGGFAIKEKTPTPVRLKAVLSSPVGANVSGWALYEGMQLSGEYSFEARLLVAQQDFKAFGIDPSNGFDDESVLLTISKKAMALKMTFSHNEAGGIVFVGAEMGSSNESIVRGDLVQASVNGIEAASGKF